MLVVINIKDPQTLVGHLHSLIFVNNFLFFTKSLIY